MDYNMIVICGPTASGKTSLGVKVAASFNGEIISADSRQVYRGMDIGSGKDLAEYNTPDGVVPCHLIDIASPDEIYTLYHFVSDFRKSFNDIVSRGRLPVMVGGSGLYIEAAIKNYDIPNVGENKALREELMLRSHEDLEAELKEKYPSIYERTDLSSKKRIVRSLEVGISGHYLNEHEMLDIRPYVICVEWPREELIERIDLRLETRLKEGMVDEVKSLLENGVSRERMMLFGMEYKYVTLYLLNEISYEEMVEKLKIEIHRLAKRQRTWFRGLERRGTQVHWVRSSDFESVVEELRKYF